MAANIAPAPNLQVPDVEPRPRLTRFNPLVAQELVRSSMAVLFVLIFAGTITWSFFLVTGHAWGNVKELLQLLLPAETALLGSAVGFYFGSKTGTE